MRHRPHRPLACCTSEWNWGSIRMEIRGHIVMFLHIHHQLIPHLKWQGTIHGKCIPIFEALMVIFSEMFSYLRSDQENNWLWLLRSIPL